MMYSFNAVAVLPLVAGIVAHADAAGTNVRSRTLQKVPPKTYAEMVETYKFDFTSLVTIDNLLNFGTEVTINQDPLDLTDDSTVDDTVELRATFFPNPIVTTVTCYLDCNQGSYDGVLLAGGIFANEVNLEVDPLTIDGLISASTSCGMSFTVENLRQEANFAVAVAGSAGLTNAKLICNAVSSRKKEEEEVGEEEEEEGKKEQEEADKQGEEDTALKDEEDTQKEDATDTAHVPLEVNKVEGYKPGDVQVEDAPAEEVKQKDEKEKESNNNEGVIPEDAQVEDAQAESLVDTLGDLFEMYGPYLDSILNIDDTATFGTASTFDTGPLLVDTDGTLLNVDAVTWVLLFDEEPNLDSVITCELNCGASGIYDGAVAIGGLLIDSFPTTSTDPLSVDGLVSVGTSCNVGFDLLNTRGKAPFGVAIAGSLGFSGASLTCTKTEGTEPLAPTMAPDDTTIPPVGSPGGDDDDDGDNCLIRLASSMKALVNAFWPY